MLKTSKFSFCYRIFYFTQLLYHYLSRFFISSTADFSLCAKGVKLQPIKYVYPLQTHWQVTHMSFIVKNPFLSDQSYHYMSLVKCFVRSNYLCLHKYLELVNLIISDILSRFDEHLLSFTCQLKMYIEGSRLPGGKLVWSNEKSPRNRKHR